MVDRSWAARAFAPTGSPPSERAIRRRCRRLARQLGFTRTVEPVELVRRFGEHRGRPLALEPRTIPGHAAFGLLVPLPGVDIIVHSDDIAPEYQAQIIYHEVMHLVLGHLDDVGDQPGGSLWCAAAWSDTAGAERRSLYEHRAEWEAETGATILSGWSSPPVSAPTVGIEHAIGRALGIRGVVA